MSTYGERLISFTSAWPYASPSPQDLADAGFSYRPTSELLDSVICQLCNIQLCDWEPADDPMQEHYRCSKSCMRLTEGDSTLMFVQDAMALPQKDAQASAQADLPASPAPKPSPKDIGFLDLSLQHEFPELCLFHDVQTFCDRIERSGFLGADILELLPKCLRGEALKWFKQSECQDLAVCLLAMRSRFPQASSPEAPQQAPPQVINQSACQTPDYHHCKLCNASFSSIARLIRHTQENVCDKPSCRHCEMVFSSKNRLHRHLREECQKQRHRSSPSPSSRSSSSSSPACSSTCSPKSLFRPSPSPPPEENRASLPPSPSPSPLPIYRMLSPPPPTYKIAKNCLTVKDLYARYAPRYLKMDDLFRMFGRRSATAAPTIPAASEHPPIRHRGRCLAKKGDGSTKPPKHLPKHLNTLNNKTNKKLKTKNPFPLLTRTPLQQIPCKSVLPLQRSRSVSYLMATPSSPPSSRAPLQSSPLPCIGYQCPISSMSALKQLAHHGFDSTS